MFISLSGVSRRLSQLYNNLITSNALFPALISLVYLSLVVGMLVFDHSQAASTTSPKVTQGLITEKAHQFVLGNQVGAIIYCLILLLFLRDKQLAIIPGFSILLSVVLGIWSIGLFVFFIHSISNAVQVTNIVQDIHTTTHAALKKPTREEEGEYTGAMARFSDLPHQYITDKPGFLQEVKIRRIVKVASRYDMVIRMHGYLTDYIISGRPLFHTNVSPADLPENAKRIIYNSIVFYPKENVRRNYECGFTQLSEVAVKALSPGVNDPGIACLCILYLTDLFVVLYGITEKRIYTDQEGKVRLIVNKITFKDLLNLCITPIRQYGVKDISVARGLLSLISVLGSVDAQEKRHRQVLNEPAESVLAGVREKLTGAPDKEAINSMIEKMHRVDSGYFRVEKV